MTVATDLLDEYKDVFEGLGYLPGEYHIVTNDAVPPVVHPPCRVPVALRNQIKEKLDEMVASDVITPLTEPTKLVSSMSVVVKPNKLCTCLDPRDLNKAILLRALPNAHSGGSRDPTFTSKEVHCCRRQRWFLAESS